MSRLLPYPIHVFVSDDLWIVTREIWKDFLLHLCRLYPSTSATLWGGQKFKSEEFLKRFFFLVCFLFARFPFFHCNSGCHSNRERSFKNNMYWLLYPPSASGSWAYFGRCYTSTHVRSQTRKHLSTCLSIHVIVYYLSYYALETWSWRRTSLGSVIICSSNKKMTPAPDSMHSKKMNFYS